VKRLSYANVMSTLALAVALGGGTAVAVNQINADKVDGLNAVALDFRGPRTVGPDEPFHNVLHQDGLVVRARCTQQSGFFLDVQAKSTQNNAEIQIVTSNALSDTDPKVALDRDFDKDELLDFPLGSAKQGEGTLTYSTPQGSHVSIVFQADEGAVLGDRKACVLGGTGLHSPP
jgi:hypothetical protein